MKVKMKLAFHEPRDKNRLVVTEGKQESQGEKRVKIVSLKFPQYLYISRTQNRRTMAR